MKFYRYFRSVATFGGSLIWELYGNALKNSVSKQVDIENKRKHKIIIHGPYFNPFIDFDPGAFPYMAYTAMCRWTGYGFLLLCPKQGYNFVQVSPKEGIYFRIFLS